MLYLYALLLLMDYLINSIIAFSLVCLNVQCNSPITKGNVQEKFQRIIVENCKDSVFLKIGDTLDIKLRTLLGRGYSWQLNNANIDSGNRVVKLLSKKTESNPNDKDDSEQITIFTFVMLDKSAHSLHFVYKRPWEKQSVSQQSCVMFINIK
ncbi:protease inhibitor I42 family protein [Longitalea luteola]|uniref:protease inhibitor I42 family protein n=1 Tax=Longitalea luteola TaxID=2812563 RepID=UPI001A96EE78|nr:protease inhibitor I42 family protein [Longitalea luteola]